MKKKNDKRWWHIKEYVSGKKALVMGRRIRFIWYRIETKRRFSFRCFRSVDMYYAHIMLFGKILEYHYYRRGV